MCVTRKNFSAWFIPVIYLSNAEQKEEEKNTTQHNTILIGTAAANMTLLYQYQSNRPEFLRNEIVASSITLFSIVPKDGFPNNSR